MPAISISDYKPGEYLRTWLEQHRRPQLRQSTGAASVQVSPLPENLWQAEAAPMTPEPRVNGYASSDRGLFPMESLVIQAEVDMQSEEHRVPDGTERSGEFPRRVVPDWLKEPLREELFSDVEHLSQLPVEGDEEPTLAREDPALYQLRLLTQEDTFAPRDI